MAAAFAAELLDLFILLLAAQLMGWLFQRLRQPGVIGEVVAGILVGPALVLLVGAPLVEDSNLLEFLAELGAIFLLFLIGIEVRFGDLLDIGGEAAGVAFLGVLLPFASGYVSGVYLGYGLVASLFLGTAFVATSVGITARVLQELDVLARPYSRVVLGAALIDDVLGLVVLAVVSGMAATGSIALAQVGWLVAASVAFLVAAVACVPLIRRVNLERIPFRTPLQLSVVLGVGFAAAAALIGLAAIVGAFFAGMVVSEIREAYPIEEAAEGISVLLTPVFFAVIGLRLDLVALTDPVLVAVGSVLTVLAILGKLLGGLASLKRGVRRAVVVGMGMVPRGEVGLIVAAIGLAAGAVTADQYALVVFVVIATTVVAPLLLRPLIAWAEEGDTETAVEAPPAAP